MDDAREAIRNGYGHGTVCLAETQNAGRGRLQGRQWENGVSSLLYTVLLDKKSSVTQYPLTQVLALALCMHLEKSYSLSPQIKWPNDVLLSGYKIAGILIEVEKNYFLAGMGLNLELGSFSAGLRSPAKGISEILGYRVDAEEELKGILGEFHQLLEHPAPLSEVIHRLAYKNRKVKIILGDAAGKQICCGHVAGLNNDGALLLNTGNDSLFPVYSGDFDFS